MDGNQWNPHDGGTAALQQLHHGIQLPGFGHGHPYTCQLVIDVFHEPSFPRITPKGRFSQLIL